MGRVRRKPRITSSHKCVICGLGFYSSATLVRHKTQVHDGVKKWSCHVCGKLFAQKSDCTRHVKRGCKLVVVKCRFCKLRFDSNWKRLTHEKQSHAEKFYKCKQCEQLFPNNSKLDAHIRAVHLDIRKFECSICGHKTATKGNLTAHMETHSTSTPLTAAQANLERYRKFRADGHQVQSIVTPSDFEYYLKLHKRQEDRVQAAENLIPELEAENLMQQHKEGYYYTSDGNERSIIQYIKGDMNGEYFELKLI